MQRARGAGLAVVGALASAVVGLTGARSHPSLGPLEFEPYTLELSDGRPIEAELGRLAVPERRDSAGARQVELAVIRLRGTGPISGAPIVYLDGNPAHAAATDALRIPEIFTFFDALRTTGDVIVMDYRGSGLSTPSLDCLSAPAPAGELRFASRAALLQTALASSTSCAARLRASGVDLAGYTWLEVAGDVGDLRRALGVPRIRLVGFSSGTHAALAFLRGHEAEVERVVMIGTEGPDHTRKLPSNVDHQLERIAALARSDSGLGGEVSDLLGLMRQVLERLEREPAVVEIEVRGAASKVRVPVGRFALELLTAKSLSGPEEFARLPLLYKRIADGDMTLLTRIAERRAGAPPPNALNYLLDGTSGVSPGRARRIADEASRSLLGDAVNFPFPDIQDAWGYRELGPAFRAPARSSVPALFATGTLDGNTPPHQAEEVRRGFRRSGRLLIENGGHASPIRIESAWPVILGFLNGETLPDTVIRLPRPRFAPLTPGRSP